MIKFTMLIVRHRWVLNRNCGQKTPFRLSQYAEHLPRPPDVYIYVERWGATTADTQFMISCKVCVCALVLLLEGIQAYRWPWFVFALNGCKPLASLVTMTNHVHTQIHTPDHIHWLFQGSGQKTLLSLLKYLCVSLMLQIILLQTWGHFSLAC